VATQLHGILPSLQQQTYVGYDGWNYILVSQTGPVETFEPSAGKMINIKIYSQWTG